ncbi:MAG TPA: hypothetical protein G4O00_03565 [Thermoflexia bacterium]|nr:hypothetical protein [Thermoflexia bacterium]
MRRVWRTFCRSAAIPVLLALFVLGVGCASRISTPHPTPEPSPSPVASPTPQEVLPSPTTAPPSPSPIPSLAPSPTPPSAFAFAVTADMRQYAGPGLYDSSHYFRGACEAIAALGDVAFMVSPGDIDPPLGVQWTISQTLGADFPWYPGVGNHEAETPDDVAWLQAYDYGPVNPGPSGCPTTTYSFDYGVAHLVMLNVYCNAGGPTITDGKIPDHLYEWLAADLQATDRPYIFVFGHEPAFPQPDAETGRERHVGDSLDAYPANRDRFWDLLASHGVVAYICGHTHNYSAVRIDGVWQLDAGHARGKGDRGAPSTFLVIRVENDLVVLETYRDDMAGGPYTLVERIPLAGGAALYLPLVTRLALTPDA